MAYGNELAISVSTPNGGNQSGAYLYYISNPDEDGLTYGSQTIQMNTTFSPFTLVQDTDDAEGRPALYFKGYYDKVVVIPESALDLGSKKIKRDLPSWTNIEVAGPGAQPWFCFWNATLLEGFIYPDEQIRALPSISASSTAPTLPYSTPAWAFTMTPTQTITTTLTMSSTTAAFTGPASEFPKWLYEEYPNFNMSSYASKYPVKPKRDEEPYEDEEFMPVYPYRIKVEERRMPGSPLPYCIQYQVLNDGDINFIPGDDGQQIVVQLSERNPPFRPVLYPEEPPEGNKRSRRKRDEFPGSCHCQWKSGDRGWR